MTGAGEPTPGSDDDGPSPPWWARALAALATFEVSILALAQQGLIEGLGNKLGPVSFGLLLVGLLGVTATPPIAKWGAPWLRSVLGRGRDEAATPVVVPRSNREANRAPFNLPPVAGFVGRADDLQVLVGASGGPGQGTGSGPAATSGAGAGPGPGPGPRQATGLLTRARVVVLAGDRGVGTSWCMCKAGHDSWDAGVLRDGRVYVDMRAAPQPLTAREAMVLMAQLANLGELPASTGDAQAAADLQRMVGGRRILFLLDNVDRPEQIRPILGANCNLLVAGGPALRGLTAAEVHEVRPLSHKDAVDLFSLAHPRRHNENIVEHTEAVQTIARLFAGQPKVLQELGGWGERRRTPAADLARALLTTLAAPPYTSVERLESIDAACRHHVAHSTLSEPARRMVCQLSMVSDFVTPDAVDALAGPLLARRSRASLDELSAAGFVELRGNDMRRLNPRLARLARLHLHHQEPLARRRRAYTRLVRHLARRATAEADRLTLMGAREPRSRAAAYAADQWFARHWRLLHRIVMTPAPRGLAAVDAPPRRSRRAWFELAQALRAWYERNGSEKRGRVLCESVREIAHAGNLRNEEGWAHNGLGAIALRRGHWTKAIEEYGAALRLRGHRGESQALTNRGIALLHLGRTDEAIEDLIEARRHRSSADRVGRGITDLNLGEALRRRGDAERARHYLVEAANALDTLDEAGYAAALTDVILVYATLGQEQDVVRAWQEALRVHERLGDEQGIAEVRLNAAVALLSFDQPRPEQADEMLTLVLAYVSDRPATPLLARTLLCCGDAAALLPDPAPSRPLWQRALDTAHEVGDPDTATEAKTRLDASPP